MKVKKVLNPRNLPARPPLYNTLVVAIALDYWNAPQWLWGVFGALYFMIWIVTIYSMIIEKQTDIFEK